MQRAVLQELVSKKSTGNLKKDMLYYRLLWVGVRKIVPAKGLRRKYINEL